LRWLRDDVFALSSDTAYEEMASWAAESPPGAGGLIFIPYLVGERTPHMNPNARGMFIGLTARHGRGHLVRAVMEGVTFALYDAFNVLKEVGANPAEAILAGGGAKSTLWQQIVADVFDMPIRLLRSVDQSAAGAALLAGAALHWFETDVSSKLLACYGDPVEPASPARDIYRELRPTYREAYQKHVADFDRLTQLEQKTQ
jgi:xylulokinase